jgi:hypothetical protein
MMGASWDPGPPLAPRLGLVRSVLLRAWRHGLLGAALPASSSRAGAAPLLGAARPASPAGAGAVPGGAARAFTATRAGAAASFPPLELLLLLLLRREPLLPPLRAPALLERRRPLLPPLLLLLLRRRPLLPLLLESLLLPVPSLLLVAIIASYARPAAATRPGGRRWQCLHSRRAARRAEVAKPTLSEVAARTRRAASFEQDSFIKMFCLLSSFVVAAVFAVVAVA